MREVIAREKRDAAAQTEPVEDPAPAAAAAPKPKRAERGQFERVVRPKKCSMLLKEVLEICYDVLEKKMLADVADEAKQNPKDSFPQYVSDYFVQKFGVKKIAMKKLGEFVGGVEHFARENARVELFGLLLGLERAETYTRHVSDAFFAVMRRVFAGASATEARSLKSAKER